MLDHWIGNQFLAHLYDLFLKDGGLHALERLLDHTQTVVGCIQDGAFQLNTAEIQTNHHTSLWIYPDERWLPAARGFTFVRLQDDARVFELLNQASYRGQRQTSRFLQLGAGNQTLIPDFRQQAGHSLAARIDQRIRRYFWQ